MLCLPAIATAAIIKELVHGSHFISLLFASIYFGHPFSWGKYCLYRYRFGAKSPASHSSSFFFLFHNFLVYLVLVVPPLFATTKTYIVRVRRELRHNNTSPSSTSSTTKSITSNISLATVCAYVLLLV